MSPVRLRKPFDMTRSLTDNSVVHFARATTMAFAVLVVGLVAAAETAQAAGRQGTGRFQDGVGHRAQQRVDAFEFADQVDVQRAGFNSLHRVF